MTPYMPKPSGWLWRLAVVALAGCVLDGGYARAQHALDEGRADALDEAIQHFMGQVGCHAATVAAGRDDEIIYARGYGWRDHEQTQPTVD